MDLNKIFSLFNGDDENPMPQGMDDRLNELEQFKDTPSFKIGMFKKIILNHSLYKNTIIDLFKNVKPELDLYELEETGKMITFERGWEFIAQCEMDDEVWKMCLNIANNEELRIALDLTLRHFQDIEEYEKCAFLKKITDFLEKDLAAQK